MNCHQDLPRFAPVARMLESARACVGLIKPEAAVQILDQWQVLDVREPTETLYGYLPHAVNVPRGQLEFEVSESAQFDVTRPVLVYSNSGRRSLLAGQSLVEMGFSGVSSLSGGIDAWRNLGLPLE